MKLFLKMICALVITVAVAPSVSAADKKGSCCSTEMTKIDADSSLSVGCTFLKAFKIALPYAALFAYYKYLFSDAKTPENKLVDLCVGVWVYEHIKDQAKYVQGVVGDFVGNTAQPAC
ncbi:MAG TPA: hypothetical protein VHO47_02550 [Candidatus Babeliales bacterium]|nr:hypothetical protein [Candidatus Babeliales bacterium]